MDQEQSHQRGQEHDLFDRKPYSFICNFCFQKELFLKDIPTNNKKTYRDCTTTVENRAYWNKATTPPYFSRRFRKTELSLNRRNGNIRNTHSYFWMLFVKENEANLSSGETSLLTNYFILLGPPASGKSTIASLLSHLLGMTPIGKRVGPYVEKQLVPPDDVVIPCILERLRMQDCKELGFILDGFPRTVGQAEALLSEGIRPKKVFRLKASFDVLKQRLIGRKSDPETERVYHKRFFRPVSTEVYERLVSVSSETFEQEYNDYCTYMDSITEIFKQYLIEVDAERPPLDVLKEIVDRIIMLENNNNVPELDWCNMNVEDIFEYRISHSAISQKKHTTEQEKQNSYTNDNTLSGHPSLVSRRIRTKLNFSKEQLIGDKVKAQVSLIRCDGFVCERETVEESNIMFRSPATEQVMLVWNERPKTCLVLAKKDPALFHQTILAVQYLKKQKLQVIVESFLQPEILANGGDGIILHASTLFKTAMPPVVCFNLGSLGFLTPFEFDSFEEEISSILEGRECLLSLRMRLLCTLLKKGYPKKEFQILNEVVVDRGASPYLCNLDCFCDNKYITTVQADGIIMSTPTGSTAYSMSAGGSMVHPSVPAILFTPICPHSLSFRPIIFPDSVQLRVDISENARSHSWASFDGKFRQQLKRGEGLLIRMSPYPFPTINKTDHTGDCITEPHHLVPLNVGSLDKIGVC
ncbi:Probable NAD kinase 2, chloroplastic [Galdieria sulphuraria]|nr:Probable NAD kinase 2, chloroplastic [Galdieria sulphuraria]